MLSLNRPLPSMLILMFQVLRTEVNASLVNWHPWSVLKISGAPYLNNASFSASTQNLVSRVLDNRQDRTRLVAQSMIAIRYMCPRAMGRYVMSVAQT